MTVKNTTGLAHDFEFNIDYKDQKNKKTLWCFELFKSQVHWKYRTGNTYGDALDTDIYYNCSKFVDELNNFEEEVEVLIERINHDETDGRKRKQGQLFVNAYFTDKKGAMKFRLKHPEIPFEEVVL